MRNLRHALIAPSLIVGALTSNTASAVTHTWCVRWNTGFHDQGYGEDYGVGSPWFGRGAKVTVSHASAPGVVQTYYASPATGCFTFSHSASSQFVAAVYAHTRIGGANNIDVRAFDSLEAYETWVAEPVDANLAFWLWWVFNPTCSGGSCSGTLTAGSSSDPVSNMIAAGTWVVHQVDGNTSPRLSGARDMTLVNHGCHDEVDSSCQAGDLLYIQPGDPLVPHNEGHRRKFLIGHEVGHWLQSQWVGGEVTAGLGDIYLVDSSPPAVPFTHHSRCNSSGLPGAHALRSEEYQGGAFLEGSAHFVSALAFNDYSQVDGWFKYYKDTNTPNYTYDLVDVEGEVANPTGGAKDWLHSSSGCTCPTSGDANCATRGVEMDWLRFYWDYRTDSGTKPTHWQVFDHWRATYVDSPTGFGPMESTHNELVDTLTTLQPGFVVRWDEKADANGADATPE